MSKLIIHDHLANVIYLKDYSSHIFHPIFIDIDMLDYLGNLLHISVVKIHEIQAPLAGTWKG